MKARQFQDRPAGQKAALVFVGLVSLVIVGLAERDIHRRPPARIRGPRIAWRVVSTNALGALAYFGIGRR